MYPAFFKNKKKVLSLLLCLSLGLLLFAPLSAEASSLEEKKEAEEEKAQALTEQKNSLQAEVDSLNSTLTEISNQLNETEEKIASKTEEIETTKEELAKAKADSVRQYLNMKQRIRYLYENGKDNYLVIFMEAENLSDFMSRTEEVRSLMDYDRRMLIDYRNTQQLIADTKTKLEQEEAELEELKTDLNAKQEELTASIAAASEKITAYENEIAAAQANALKYEQELEKQKEEEAARQREALAAQQRAQAQQAAAAGAGTSGDASGTTAAVQNPSYASSGSDLDMMAAIIFCEAGNQIMTGKIAVGAVVLNRMRSPRFPGSLSGVLYQSGQFSPVMSGRYAVVLGGGLATQECYTAAQRAFAGEDPTGGCLFFHRANGAPGLVIQDHVFY